jgi:hypothetical protein
MFAFDRSALAVLAPLALLLAVVVWSNRAAPSAPQQAQSKQQPDARAQTVAANLPSR